MVSFPTMYLFLVLLTIFAIYCSVMVTLIVRGLRKK